MFLCGVLGEEEEEEDVVRPELNGELVELVPELEDPALCGNKLSHSCAMGCMAGLACPTRLDVVVGERAPPPR